MAIDDEVEWEDDDPAEPAYRADVDADGVYICDHCGEEIVIPLDIAAGRDQQYVEDCPVCCSPNVIHVQIDGEAAQVWAEAE